MSASPQVILIEKEGVRQIISLQEWEAICGATFSSSLEFESPSLRSKIEKKTEKLYKKGELSRQQIWFGSYFKKEMEASYFPDVVLRYINPTLGWGVFAEKNFRKTEFIAEYSGLLRKSRRSDKTNAYCFEYTLANGVKTPYTIDAQDKGGLARFLNHSTTPNVLSVLATRGFVSHVILITQREIKKGEQLCYDYGEDYWLYREKPIEISSPQDKPFE